jgi:hypothetical protein
MCPELSVIVTEPLVSVLNVALPSQGETPAGHVTYCVKLTVGLEIVELTLPTMVVLPPGGTTMLGDGWGTAKLIFGDAVVALTHRVAAVCMEPLSASIVAQRNPDGDKGEPSSVTWIDPPAYTVPALSEAEMYVLVATGSTETAIC